MKTFTAAEVAATTPEQLAALRAGPPAVYAAWIKKAADMGLTEAQAIYGQMLLDGAGIGRDPVQALSWFKRAAHADHLMSINMVGRCYENGWGVPRDEVVAAYWFRLAADRGLDWGMYNYAHMLRQGRGGVPQDQAAALAGCGMSAFGRPGGAHRAAFALAGCGMSAFGRPGGAHGSARSEWAAGASRGAGQLAVRRSWERER